MLPLGGQEGHRDVQEGSPEVLVQGFTVHPTVAYSLVADTPI